MRTLLFLTVLFSVGCATTSGISKQVQVYDEGSAFIAGCKKLAPVEATAVALDANRAEARATEAVMEQAAKLGGDGVAILETNRFGFASTNIQAVALKCFETVVSDVR